jgi:hypothetical protein
MQIVKMKSKKQITNSKSVSAGKHFLSIIIIIIDIKQYAS